jgi:hypothetical protein
VPLVTPAQIREHYPSLVGTGEDARLAVLADRVDELLATWAGYPLTAAGGRTLQLASYVATVHGPDRQYGPLRLPTRAVSVSSVLDSGVTVTAPYTLDHDLIEGTWYPGYRRYKVSYQAGWATTPPGLVAIASMAVRDLIDRSKTGEQISGSSSRQSYSRPAAMHLLSESVRAAVDSGYTEWGSRVG